MDTKAPETEAREQISFSKRLHDGWDRFAFQSSFGSRTIRIVLTLIVFASLYSSVNYGLASKGSLINYALAFLPLPAQGIYIVGLGMAILSALVWFVRPVPGTGLCAVLLYVSLADFSPLALMAALLLLLMFQLEDRPVTALMLALPALVLQTEVKIGLFVVVFAVFLSTRKNNGSVRVFGFLYLFLLELCGGAFGSVFNARGLRIFPALNRHASVMESLEQSFQLMGHAKDSVLLKLLLPLLIYFVVGIVFSKLSDHRFKKDKFPIGVQDGIIFAALLLVLCAASYAVLRFSKLTGAGYSYPSIALQVLAAYLVTRPMAGRSPYRGDLLRVNNLKYAFISYAHYDLQRIKPYFSFLIKNGYDFWYDSSLKAGDEWQNVIANNLSGCACFLAFISNNSIDSKYCLKEINYAISKKKPLVLIVLDDIPLPPVLEMQMASLQAVYRYKLDSDWACMQEVCKLDALDKCKDERKNGS